MWSLANDGRLNYTGVYFHPRVSVPATAQQQSTKKNINDIPSIYVNSVEPIENGHLAAFTGDPAILANNQVLQTFDHDLEPDYAMSSVQAHTTESSIAGIVLNTAASPSDDRFTHENGFTSQHAISGHGHILRLARPGSVSLAWVLDDHENTWNGVYQKTVNGVHVSDALIRDIDDIYFTIEDLSGSAQNLQDQINSLRERFDSLTQNN